MPAQVSALSVSVVGPNVTRMIIDCGKCAVRGDSCADCVVTFLSVPVRGSTWPPGIGGPVDPGCVDLDAAERDAVGVLADAGLVPPLRLRRVV